MNRPNGHINWKMLLNYFRGAGSNSDRYSLEKQMMQDRFDCEAFEGLRRLDAGQLGRDMDDLYKRLKSKEKQTTRYVINKRWALAASLLLPLTVGLLLYNFLNPYSYQPETLTNRTVVDEQVLQKEIDTAVHDTVSFTPDLGPALHLPSSNKSLISRSVDVNGVKPADAYQPKAKANDDNDNPAPGETDHVDGVAEPVTLAEHPAAAPAGIGYPVHAGDGSVHTPVMIRSMKSDDERNRRVSAKEQSPRRVGAADAEQLEALMPSVAMTGQVVDALTRMPIPFVCLLDNEGNAVTSTDVEGRFNLSGFSEGEDSLVARFAGFAAKHFRFIPGTDALITLEELMLPVTTRFAETDAVAIGNTFRSEPLGIPMEEADEQAGYMALQLQSAGYIQMQFLDRMKVSMPVHYEIRQQSKALSDFLDLHKRCHIFRDGCRGQRVKVRVTVSRQNELIRILVLESTGELIAEEVRRLLKEYLGWKADVVDGMALQSWFELTVVF